MYRLTKAPLIALQSFSPHSFFFFSHLFVSIFFLFFHWLCGTLSRKNNTEMYCKLYVTFPCARTRQSQRRRRMKKRERSGVSTSRLRSGRSLSVGSIPIRLCPTTKMESSSVDWHNVQRQIQSHLPVTSATPSKWHLWNNVASHVRVESHHHATPEETPTPATPPSSAA